MPEKGMSDLEESEPFSPFNFAVPYSRLVSFLPISPSHSSSSIFPCSPSPILVLLLYYSCQFRGSLHRKQATSKQLRSSPSSSLFSHSSSHPSKHNTMEYEDVLTNQPVVIDNVRQPCALQSGSLMSYGRLPFCTPWCLNFIVHHMP